MTCTMSVSAEFVTLPAFAKGGGEVRERVLTAEAPTAEWRTVWLWSNAPFEADVAWSGGSGTGPNVQVSVARAARLCVFARHLKIDAVALTASPTQVNVSIVDARTETHNVLERNGTGTGATSGPFAVPPFASRVRLEIADHNQAALLHLFDGQNDVLSTTRADPGTALEVPLGATRIVRANVPAGVPYRLLFLLEV